MSEKKKYDCNSVHLDLVLLAAVVAAGPDGPDARQPVGVIQTEDGDFESLFAHWDKATGAIRTSPNGRARFNARKQVAKTPEGLTVTADQLAALKGLSPEQLAAIVAAAGAPTGE